jgi:hypothetical protein
LKRLFSSRASLRNVLVGIAPPLTIDSGWRFPEGIPCACGREIS